MSASTLIRSARRAAGLTQAELAERAGVPQSVVARLESPGSNPTLRTVERLLTAADHTLAVAEAGQSGVDASLIERNLALTPAQRFEAFRRSQRNVSRMLRKARPTRGRRE
jgi:transcriptional regulator with XRE-family HTH domain